MPARFRQESARLRKMLPSVASLGSNPEDVLGAIRPTKEKIGALLTEIDESAKRMKVRHLFATVSGRVAIKYGQAIRFYCTPGPSAILFHMISSFGFRRKSTGNVKELYI